MGLHNDIYNIYQAKCIYKRIRKGILVNGMRDPI